MRCKLCNMKVQTIQKMSCNFREKLQNFAKCKYTGGQIQQKWSPFKEDACEERSTKGDACEKRINEL